MSCQYNDSSYGTDVGRDVGDDSNGHSRKAASNLNEFSGMHGAGC